MPHAQFNCKQSNWTLCTRHRSRRKRPASKPRIEAPRRGRHVPPRIQRTTTMSTIRNIALISTLATLVASPAFALDQDTAATTINSGRYFGEQVSNVSGAYASARKIHVPAGAYASAHRNVAQPVLQRDFQLEGRGLGE